MCFQKKLNSAATGAAEHPILTEYGYSESQVAKYFSLIAVPLVDRLKTLISFALVWGWQKISGISILHAGRNYRVQKVLHRYHWQ